MDDNPTHNDPLGFDHKAAREAVAQAWNAQNWRVFHRLIADLHASDLALIVGDIRPDERIDFLKKLKNKQLLPAILIELEDGLRADIVPQLPLAVMTRAIEALESDDRLALIEDLSEAHQQKLLSLLGGRIRDDLIRSLEFDGDSAGRMMRRECVTIPHGWQVGQVIDYLRGRKTKLPDFQNIMVIDTHLRPVGVLRSSKLLSNKRDAAIAEIMDMSPRVIAADMPKEDVVQLFRRYGLVENPVVSAQGVLLGTITHDDVIDEVDDQAEDDLLNLAGVAEHGFYDDVFRIAQVRASWLLVNLLTAILASAAIALFETALMEIVALAILMPIIASMGGNAGTQSLAVTVRALALEYLSDAARTRLIMKETAVGLLNGLFFALLAAGAIYLWFGRGDLSLVIAAAMVMNLAAATLSGSLIPILLQHFSFDPATGSAVILTTITDIIGFCAFLGMASWLLL